jgi:hypothetical protein
MPIHGEGPFVKVGKVWVRGVGLGGFELGV